MTILPNLLKSVNGAFAGISSTLKSLRKEVKGVIGLVENALGGVNLSITSLIDSIVDLTTATVRQLSSAVDDSLKNIIQTFVKLVDTVNKLLKTIKNISSTAISSLQSILKASLIVAKNSLKTISISLKELTHFVPVVLSTVVKTLDEQVTDSDVSVPIDVDAIISDLQKCSEGTVVDVEIVSSTLDGTSEYVDIVITAISTCPPVDGKWGVPLEDLGSAIRRSFEEILCVIESVTKKLPDWNSIIRPTITKTLLDTEELIKLAISVSNGNVEDQESAYKTVALSVRDVLNALDSITTLATCQNNELAANTLESIQLSVQSVVGNANDVFDAISLTIGEHVCDASILFQLLPTLDIAINGQQTELLTIIPAIEEIVTNCNN